LPKANERPLEKREGNEADAKLVRDRLNACSLGGTTTWNHYYEALGRLEKREGNEADAKLVRDRLNACSLGGTTTRELLYKAIDRLEQGKGTELDEKLVMDCLYGCRVAKNAVLSGDATDIQIITVGSSRMGINEALLLYKQQGGDQAQIDQIDQLKFPGRTCTFNEYQQQLAPEAAAATTTAGLATDQNIETISSSGEPAKCSTLVSEGGHNFYRCKLFEGLLVVW
jgi:hypothetical protein